MRKEVNYILALISLGAGIVVYAHATFATKQDVKSLIKMVERIDERVYNIHQVLK